MTDNPCAFATCKAPASKALAMLNQTIDDHAPADFLFACSRHAGWLDGHAIDIEDMPGGHVHGCDAKDSQSRIDNPPGYEVGYTPVQAYLMAAIEQLLHTANMVGSATSEMHIFGELRFWDVNGKESVQLGKLNSHGDYPWRLKQR